jgi:hypothetical protein
MACSRSCISCHDRWNGRTLDDDLSKLGSEASRSVNPLANGNFRWLIPVKNKGIAAENGSILCSALDERLAARLITCGRSAKRGHFSLRYVCCCRCPPRPAHLLFLNELMVLWVRVMNISFFYMCLMLRFCIDESFEVLPQRSIYFILSSVCLIGLSLLL